MKFQYLGKTLEAKLRIELLGDMIAIPYLDIYREDEPGIGLRQNLHEVFATLPDAEFSDALALRELLHRTNKTLKKHAIYLTGDNTATGAGFRGAILDAFLREYKIEVNQ